MISYLQPIYYGLIIFLIIALLMIIPYLIWHFHKFGSLPIIRVVIVYSFILYLLIAYFLVIMPLPSQEEVILMKSPSIQLIPFTFVIDLIKGIKKSSVVIYKVPSLYTIIFNLFLTIPFGCYLRFYFKKDIKQILLYSFLLSLFFEITQLTGLYFIYPRAYRLFDVDDLLINTLGGVIGYYVGNIIMKFMPSIDDIDEKALNKGKDVSFTRRLVSFGLDYVIYLITLMIIKLIFLKSTFDLLDELWLMVYYLLIPMIKGQTIANKILNLKINCESNYKYLRIALRQILFYVGVFYLPFKLFTYIGMSVLLFDLLVIRIVIMMITIFICFIYYLILFIKLISRKEMFYDEYSQTRLVSTIE